MKARAEQRRLQIRHASAPESSQRALIVEQKRWRTTPAGKSETSPALGVAREVAKYYCRSHERIKGFRANIFCVDKLA
jgi:hypothetical protein